jgi:predicted metal-binding transcription factor (methanogenesis marker protein 9)
MEKIEEKIQLLIKLYAKSDADRHLIRTTIETTVFVVKDACASIAIQETNDPAVAMKIAQNILKA